MLDQKELLAGQIKKYRACMTKIKINTNRNIVKKITGILSIGITVNWRWYKTYYSVYIMSRLFRNISEFSKTKKSCQTFLYVTLLQRLRSVNISMFLDEIDGVYCFYHSFALLCNLWFIRSGQLLLSCSFPKMFIIGQNLMHVHVIYCFHVILNFYELMWSLVL